MHGEFEVYPEIPSKVNKTIPTKLTKVKAHKISKNQG